MIYDHAERLMRTSHPTLVYRGYVIEAERCVVAGYAGAPDCLWTVPAHCDGPDGPPTGLDHGDLCELLEAIDELDAHRALLRRVQEKLAVAISDDLKDRYARLERERDTARVQKQDFKAAARVLRAKLAAAEQHLSDLLENSVHVTELQHVQDKLAAAERDIAFRNAMAARIAELEGALEQLAREPDGLGARERAGHVLRFRGAEPPAQEKR